MSGPRNYSVVTIKRLFALSCNRCAFKDCDMTLVNESNAANSNICHIEAAYPNGERYNSKMTDEARADYPNLILLCPSHHNVTNDVTIYTTTVLKQMKAEHEQRMRERLSAQHPLTKRPTLLASVIGILSTFNDEDDIQDYKVDTFGIEQKIQHNNIKNNILFINEFAIYSGKLQKIYNEQDISGSNRTRLLLLSISNSYKNQKTKILDGNFDLQNIQNHADELIDAVKRDLHEKYDQSHNCDLSLAYEEVDFAISVIVVDAFMRCKILEAPL